MYGIFPKTGNGHEISFQKVFHCLLIFNIIVSRYLIYNEFNANKTEKIKSDAVIKATRDTGGIKEVPLLQTDLIATDPVRIVINRSS